MNYLVFGIISVSVLLIALYLYYRDKRFIKKQKTTRLTYRQRLLRVPVPCEVENHTITIYRIISLFGDLSTREIAIIMRRENLYLSRKYKKDLTLRQIISKKIKECPLIYSTPAKHSPNGKTLIHHINR